MGGTKMAAANTDDRLDMKFRAFDLPAMDVSLGTESSDPYLRIVVGKKRLYDGKNNPVKQQNKDVVFPDISIPAAEFPEALTNDVSIKIEVMDWDRFNSDDAIGYVRATVGELKAKTHRHTRTRNCRLLGLLIRRTRRRLTPTRRRLPLHPLTRLSALSLPSQTL